MYTQATIALLATTVLALPTQTSEKRTCTTIYPTSSNYILNANYPTSVYPSGNTVKLAKEAGQSLSTLLQFNNIPSGSYGCQVNVAFPSGVTFGTGSTAVNVYTNPVPLPAGGPTYSNPKPNSGIFGTTTLQSPQKSTVNTHCPESTDNGVLALTVAYPDWVSDQTTNSLEFTNAPGNGFYMTYNC